MIEETLNNNGLYLEGGIWKSYDTMSIIYKQKFNLTFNPFLKWDSKSLSDIKANVKKRLEEFFRMAYPNREKLPEVEGLDILIGMITPDEIEDEEEYKKKMNKFKDEFLQGKNKNFNIINYIHCLTSVEVHRRLEKGEEVFVW